MFEFKSNKVTVETETEKFEINPSDATAAFSRSLEKFAEYKKLAGENPSKETVERICGGMVGIIDDILGKTGACESIFAGAGRKISFYDLCDLYFYISDKVKEFNDTKAKEWSEN